MNNKKQKVCLIVDHPDRDGLGILLTGMELAARGYEVYMVPFNICTLELPRIGPDFVLLNYVRINNEKFAKFLLDSGVLVGVIDTEGGAIANFDIFINAHPKDQEMLKKIHLFCSWNENFKNFLIKHDLIPSNVIKVTGQPRLDYYHKSFLPFYAYANHPSSQFQNFILINTTFAFTSPRFSTPEKELEQFVGFYGGNRAIVQELFDKEILYKKDFFPCLSSLIESHPEHLFIYRPHPFESLENYEKFMSKFTNVKLGLEGTVDGWLIHSIGLIHTGCSTALEASFLDIPAIMAGYPNLPECSAEILDCSQMAKNYEEIQTYISRIGEKKSSAKHAMIAESILCKNTGLSYAKVADEIQAVFAAQKPNFYAPALSYDDNVIISPVDTGLRKLIKKVIINFRLQSLFKFGNKRYLIQKRVEKWKKSPKYFILKKFQDPFEALKQTKAEFLSADLSIEQNNNSLKITGKV